MLAALLAALAFQAAEPPVVVSGVPVSWAEVEAVTPREEWETTAEWRAGNAAVIVDRLWIDREAERRGLELGPGARGRLGVDALRRTRGVPGYGRWLARAAAHWRERTACAPELIGADHWDLLTAWPAQLSDVCAGAERREFLCEPLAMLRLCHAVWDDEPYWFVAGDATRFVGGRANFAAELFVQRRLRRDHPRVARRIEWDTDADFIDAIAGTRRDALVVLHTVARLAAERGLTRTR